VDVIVGPGNLYVTLAKKIVAGTVGIDIIAGPSEVLVLADDSADPEFIAADLLPGRARRAGLGGPGDHFRGACRRRPGRSGAAAIELGRAEIARESVARFGAIFVVPDVSIGIDLSNRLAPNTSSCIFATHLLVSAKSATPGRVHRRVHPRAGGRLRRRSQHVLPTPARPLRFRPIVDHFLKRTSVIHYSRGVPPRGCDIMRLPKSKAWAPTRIRPLRISRRKR